MLGSRVQDPRRPHATFLLPAFPGFLRRHKPVRSTARDDDHDLAHAHALAHPPSNRTSVASAVSVRTTSTQSTASTASSPTTAPSLGTSLGTSPDRCCVDLAEPEAVARPLDTTPSAPPRRRLARTHPDTLRCRRCSADLAFAAQIVSKGFTGRHGRAYLVSAPATSPGHLFAPGVGDSEFPGSNGNGDDDDDDGSAAAAAAAAAFDRARFRNDARDPPLANVRVGRAEPRQLLTGAHVVADMACAQCDTRLGWKYVDARDAAQRYKAGKFILDVAQLAPFRSWEDVDVDDEDEDARMGPAMDPDPDAVEFDSDDDDECEEIFAGTWDAATVAARRRRREAGI